VGTGAVQDASGNYLSAASAFTFMTVYDDTDTPTILHAIPETTDTASIDARMVLFMSERVSASTGSATIGSSSVKMTQSTWAGFQAGTAEEGYVVVEGARVTMAPLYTALTAGSVTFGIDGASLVDAEANAATSASFTFTAATFTTFDEPTITGADFGGDADVQMVGATAVSCGETLYLVGGGDDKVSTWGGAAGWSTASTTGLGNRLYASVATDKDCALWVVGGSGGATGLAKSVDFGKTFAPVAVTPLPVSSTDADGKVVVAYGDDIASSLPGSSVAIVNGWQAVVCGGGLDTCWVCKDPLCGVAGRSAPVPAAVKNRFYGSMLVVDGDGVYYLGGQDAAVGSETLCHQSVYMWDFFNDQWEGMTAQIDLSTTADQRCESAYAQAGDGKIVVLGGNNDTTATKGAYSIGALTTVLQGARPLLDSATVVAGSTYASGYAAPVVFAHGPTGTDLEYSASEPVVLVFSEPVQASTGCVTIDATGTSGSLYCIASEGSCFTNACNTPWPEHAVAGTTVSVAGSVVTIGAGVRAGGYANGVTVTLADDIVKDVMGNGFLKAGRNTLDDFSFGFAAAPANFAGAFVQPAASAAVDLDTNFVFDFNRVLDEATSIMPGFSLTLTPLVGDAILPYDENSTEYFTFAGDILKVRMREGSSLIPGMTYTAALVASSIQSTDTTPSSSASLTQTFTARNGPARGAGAAEAGVAYVVDGPAMVEDVYNDTAGTPTVTSISPPDGMTGVRKDQVHVVYTFSESVTLSDAANQSNGVISEAFTLRFYNTSGTPKWDDAQDLEYKTEVFVNTTGKTITVALSSHGRAFWGAAEEARA